VHITESLDKILSNRELLTQRFYTENLFKTHPEFASYFDGANMKVQSLMLMMALQGVVCVISGSYPAVEQYLRYLGTKHHRRGIPQELYPKFCDVLLATVEEFHGEAWNEELACQWRAALEGATAMMREGYRHDYHV
jgi:hemoglobin-like flavoprotein